MSMQSLILIITSVLLTAFSQILLKIGMARPDLQAALASDAQPMTAISAIVTSPFVIVGMASFGLSAVVWLLVLSKVPVSTAYPFVSLGIVITVTMGHFLLGETLGAMKIVGVLVIVLGVVTVAAAR